MVLKQKGKPEKGKKPVRGAPRQFSDPREFPDGPIEEFESLRVKRDKNAASSEGEGETSEVESESSCEEELIIPANNKLSSAKPSSSSNPSALKESKELSRREREAIQKEQARQHYLKMKEKEDAARLALIRKQREEAAAQHAEALKAKEAAKRR